ncbi:hypothetical protein L861_07440 [Litchfieldella anticariensis FP35 = DSM 16096]|uniref:Uncharacterized protein n=1 Tax=Litchfieldella anticariensis (strain DSM 16096 / CECT 5854 / CIP 108499 / LMG 22089 / FP35) TaxID=1121939 RepID=S2KDP7_LITA3|nr:hypothetical protein [Halomonas anticariensis]EPC00322.1 hypothetical protein L861_07440 [Halomonas anticariensis FP35 = DSM 16096]
MTRFRFLLPALLASLTLIVSPFAMAQSAEREWDAYRDALERGERQANYWQYGWTGFYATTLAVNAYQASEASDSNDRFDARVGAVKSALALGGMFFDRQPHPEARRELERLYAEDDLALARALIEQTAAVERERRSWRARVGSLIVNTAGGLVIGIGDDRPSDGAISFATGMLINELQIWTQPRQAGVALNNFQPARLSMGEMHFDYEYAFVVAPNQVGMHIRY